MREQLDFYPGCAPRNTNVKASNLPGSGPGPAKRTMHPGGLEPLLTSQRVRAACDNNFALGASQGWGEWQCAPAPLPY
jgi:hypothetical protein